MAGAGVVVSCYTRKWAAKGTATAAIGGGAMDGWDWLGWIQKRRRGAKDPMLGGLRGGWEEEKGRTVVRAQILASFWVGCGCRRMTKGWRLRCGSGSLVL